MRAEKESIVAEIRGKLEGAGFAYLLDYQGLTVEQLTELRDMLVPFESSMTVVKNTFLKRAVADTGGPDGLPLTGPTALVAGTGDPGAVAKALVGYIKTTDLLSIKGGQLGQRLLTAADIEAIAKIPPREQLYAQLVGTLAAPMTQLVGVMQQKVASLLYVLKAVEDKKRENA